MPDETHDWDALKVYVQAPDADDEFVEQCWLLADELVSKEIGTDVVPDVAVEQATVLCGSELYHRRNAPNGIASFTTPDGSPIRVARDPMVAAKPILSPFLGAGFA